MSSQGADDIENTDDQDVRGCSDSKVLGGKIRSEAEQFTSAKNIVYTENRDGKNVPALNEEALAELAQVKEKLVVVSAVGGYRTGKSYLLSRLSNEAGGFAKFQVGHTSEPQTKGMWLMLIDHPTLPEYKIALMDTEGVGDTKKGDIQHDATLFVMTCLLSNVMIYNGKNTIDEGALEKFSFTAEMSRYLVLQSKDNNDHDDDDDDDGDDIQRFFPELVYVVRDFGLDLTDGEGREVTSDEYFDQALGVDETADSMAQRTRVRNCIRKYFQRRKCFTLNAPAASKKTLVKMDTIDDEDLDEDFISGMSDLCRYIVKQTETVEKGRILNGRGFATLLEIYVSAYQQGDVPNISSAMNTLKVQENRRALETAEAFYEKEMEEFRAQKMPTEQVGEVIDAHEELKTTVTEQARKDAMIDEEEEEDFIEQLHEKLNSKKDFFIKENERISKTACLNKLDLLYKPINTKKVEKYNCAGGHREYLTDMALLKQQYEAESGLGVLKRIVLSEFLEGKKADNDSILAVDIAMTEKENQRIEQVRIADEERRQRKLRKQEAAERAREDEERKRKQREKKAEMQRRINEEQAERRRVEREAENRMREMERQRQRDEDYRRQALYDLQQQRYMSSARSSASVPPPAPATTSSSYRCRMM